MPISLQVKDSVERLKANDPILTSIDLEHSKIGDDEARSLAEALKVNTTLTSIHL